MASKKLSEKRSRPVVVEVGRLAAIKFTATEIARWLVKQFGDHWPFS